MRRIKKILQLLWILISHRPIQTIYINFRMLPFLQAIRMPIFVYTKTEFRSLSGGIEILGKVFPNMIHIGDNTRYPTTNRPLSIWTINGKIIFNGPIKFFQGTYVYVAKNAILNFGTNGTFIGSDSKIICRNQITIGNSVEITWECQIYDTSFHYIKINGEEVHPLTKPIIINDYAWIGNRTTISKGCILPSHSIVASGSLCNKDYSKYGEKCLFVGFPVFRKMVDTDRIYSSDEEQQYDKQFGYIRYKL
mgnify:CR=1 FL=1